MRDEIIRMAREADLVTWGFDSLEWELVSSMEALERFYNLAVQHERDLCAGIAKKHQEKMVVARNETQKPELARIYFHQGCIAGVIYDEIRARGEKT